MRTDGSLPDIPEADRAIEVRHPGELLGALTKQTTGRIHHKSRREAACRPSVASRAELLARLEELPASRERLVTAQDQERRRLERNLHDGAQQNLVALKVKLGLAQAIAEKDPAGPRT